MKRFTALLLVLVLSLCALTACGEDVAKGTNYSAEEIYKEMTTKVTLPEAMMEQAASVEYYQNELGLDFSKYANYVCTRSEDFMKAEVIIIIKFAEGSSSADKQTAEKALKEYADNQTSVFSTYEPEAAKVAEKAVVATKGDFVYLIMSEKVTELKAVLNEMIK